MKKLQLFIIISSVFLASYVCPSDCLVTDDINSFFVDSDYSGKSELRAALHGSLNIPPLNSEVCCHPFISSDVGITDIQSDTSDTDIDIPEEPKINVHGVSLALSAFEGALVLTVRCPAAELFRFSLDAYRLRI